jgi:TRAP-type mannitol/chloroaromatic compound transport system substrate-binding protein
MEQARVVSEALMEEKAAANPAYAKVYTHWKAFRDASNTWFDTAERAFIEAQGGRGDPL